MSRDLGDNDFLVVGIGTRMSRDDEIGLLLVERLTGDRELAERCLLLEAADAAYVTSFLLETRRPVLLVDCADMGLLGGEYRFFGDKDQTVRVHSDSVSTHGMGLAEGLALARVLGFDAPAFFFAVQPFDLSPCFGLTLEMASRVDFLVEMLRQSAETVRRSVASEGDDVIH